MARTVQACSSSFRKRRPLLSMVNTTYAAKKAKMRSESYVWDHPSVRRDVSSSSQPTTEVVLPPNKPKMKSLSKNLVIFTESEPYSEISFQDALEGVVPPAPTKPRTRSSSQIKVSTTSN